MYKETSVTWGFFLIVHVKLQHYNIQQLNRTMLEFFHSMSQDGDLFCVLLKKLAHMKNVLLIIQMAVDY